MRGPDWHSRHIPVWRQVLAPLLEVQAEQPLALLEIGSYEGRSAAWLARELLGHPRSFLACVDPFDDVARRDAFNVAIAATGRAARVDIHCGRSADVLPKLVDDWRGALDLVYVDGSHEAPDVLLDSVLALELLKPGGILLWDDYEWRGGEDVHAPKMAIDAVLAVHAERLRVLHKGIQVAAEKLR